ncbi:XRE family transcriptional regulator [Aphanothece sacrum]|uniref:Transcriptional regulator n=1 Tax=Aphanothece sacrum FPU1 TaxID=1920663 RepID=A0A401IJI5_APHSA|nr:XRE family transcriptional regulator [Aphanothece sacrum]GBF81376.1 transcriptional regulator [Aphanothece sacrum FPU1]GBF85433.1 transcriptional regulator [Aphanothece sacrum FPU3]
MTSTHELVPIATQKSLLQLYRNYVNEYPLAKLRKNAMAKSILDKINLNQLGERLQQARKQCGMTQADAANVIDVASTTIVAIEKGERRLKSSELIKLARAYGRKISDFVQNTPVIESFDVQFRVAYRRGETEEVEIKPIILEFEKLCQNYLELEKIMDAPLPRNYPQEYNLENMPLESAAESIANTERQRLGLGDRAIPLLRDILEQEVGLRIFYLPMPSKSKCSEIYSYNEQMGGCLAINAYHPKERQLWSLAHGYLHFLSHRYKPVINYEDQYQRMPESERLAEAFPKYFLMPTSSLLKQFNDMYRTHGKFTPTNLLTLAYYYGVSVQALIYRLEEMNLLPSGTWDRLKNRGLKVRKAQEELGFQENKSRIDLTPIHYQHLAIEAFDQGLITEGRFANFIRVDRLEARRIAEILREYSSGMTEENMDLDLRQGS